MSSPGSKKRERTKDQVPRYPVRSDDHPVTPRRLLDQDLDMLRPGQAGDELGVRHRPVDGRVPPDIPEPPAREDRDPPGKPETPGDMAAVLDEPDLVRDRPALVDTDRGKEEEVPFGGLEERYPLQVVDAGGRLEGRKRGRRRQSAPDSGIDIAGEIGRASCRERV